MRYKPLAFVMFSFLFLGASPGWPQLKKVRLSAPTLAITEVPFKIAQANRMIAKELGLNDSSLAAQMFDWHGTQLAENGSADQAWMKGAIEFTKKSLGVTKETPPEQVFDFTSIEKASR